MLEVLGTNEDEEANRLSAEYIKPHGEYEKFVQWLEKEKENFTLENLKQFKGIYEGELLTSLNNEDKKGIQNGLN
jgi:hypothetical protein